MHYLLRCLIWAILRPDINGGVGVLDGGAALNTSGVVVPALIAAPFAMIPGPLLGNLALPALKAKGVVAAGTAPGVAAVAAPNTEAGSGVPSLDPVKLKAGFDEGLNEKLGAAVARGAKLNPGALVF